MVSGSVTLSREFAYRYPFVTIFTDGKMSLNNMFYTSLQILMTAPLVQKPCEPRISQKLDKGQDLNLLNEIELFSREDCYFGHISYNLT
jgi:hypothetical protein